MRVLVTGGTGRLGRPLVPMLKSDGHDVRVLSRRPGDGRVVGDLADGSGIAEALDGVDTVVHAATSAHMKRVDVRGTEGLLRRAEEAGVTHFVYVSIVGVEKNPLPYYKAKLAAESAVRASGVPCTVARGTQFYELVDGLFTRLRLGHVLVAPKGWRIEPHAPVDFAAHLARRVADGPAQGITEFGGPHVYDSKDLAEEIHRAHGRTGAVRMVRVPGRISRAVAAGAQVSGPDAEHGTTTYAEWVTTSA